MRNTNCDVSNSNIRHVEKGQAGGWHFLYDTAGSALAAKRFIPFLSQPPFFEIDPLALTQFHLSSFVNTTPQINTNAMPPRRRPQRSPAVKAKQAFTNSIPPSLPRPTRPRRTVSSSVPDASSSATVSRSPSSRMRLTVKTSSSKLREATRSSSSGNGNAVISVNSREQFVGGEILEGKRARNVKRSYVLESEEDDEDEEMEDADVDAEGEDEEMEDADLDAEGEDDEDAEGEEDDEMEAPPPPPVIKISKAKQTVTVKTKPRGNLMSVEQKEVQDEDGSDEELSELDSDIGEVEEEEAMQTGNEEDAEGEDEEIEVEEEADDDDELDSDDETPGGGSRASTPDLNKLTKRQRARLEEGGSGHLLALPDVKSRGPFRSIQN